MGWHCWATRHSHHNTSSSKSFKSGQNVPLGYLQKTERKLFPFISMLFSFLHMSKWQSRKENVSNLVSAIFSAVLLKHISLLSEGQYLGFQGFIYGYQNCMSKSSCVIYDSGLIVSSSSISLCISYDCPKCTLPVCNCEDQASTMKSIWLNTDTYICADNMFCSTSMELQDELESMDVAHPTLN